MKQEELIAWLDSQKATLDSVIAKAGVDFYETNKSRTNFAFDLGECQIESYLLANNMDLCYDRPNTPFVYSLWYHARRVNTFLTHFASVIFNSPDKEIDFFDLGAGTGAVQWAVGLIYHKMREAGHPTPKIRIINIDTSPFMLAYSKEYLWKHFIEHYPYCKEIDSATSPIEYDVNSWSNQRKVAVKNPWITASYLFDISDTSDNEFHYKEAVVKGFNDIVKSFSPAKMLLLTSKSKEYLVDEVAKSFNKDFYFIDKIRENSLLLKGRLDRVNQLRSHLHSLYKDVFETYKELSIQNAATWNDISFVGTVISKRQATIFSIDPEETIRLSNPSIKIRRDVELNDEQKKAARNIERPSVIIGPAGCGKSIVITERILNIVKESGYNPNLRILLTTFNKELLGQLAIWLNDILDQSKFRLVYDRTYFGSQDKPCKFFFNGNETGVANIRLLHFDMLPKLIGQIPYWGIVDDNTHNNLLRTIIQEVKTVNKITDDRYDSILNPEFLLEEYQRVIYGLQVGVQDSKEEYLNVSRKGRGTKLDKDRRELVWQCLKPYAHKIFTNKIPSFTLRRQLFLSKLRRREINEIYDYIIVDEFQDCTKADFETFFHLLRDPNHLVISGDLAQAVHLGRSANIETLREAIREGRSMNDISWNYLEGSYRLPFRICEAVRGISEHINLTFKGSKAASILTPYKGAPPGARPIIVSGINEEDISTKIFEIIRTYEIYDLKLKCILEKDDLLASKTLIESDTVLRLKGMEKHLVVWSTRKNIESKKERFEFVYTILSRTSSILIIALYDNPEPRLSTQPVYYEPLKLLRRDRLIFWDKASRLAFNKFTSFTSAIDIDDEE